MSIASPQRIALLIFLAALLFRLCFLPFSLLHPQSFSGASVTFDGYYEIATNIEKGNGFSRSMALPIVPDSVRMPLYPLLIAGANKLFGTDKAIILIQMLLGSLSAVFAWLIARKFLSPSLSIVVGLLVALEPYSASLTSVLLTETIFTCAFLAGLLLFMQFLERPQMRMLVFSSLLFGIATLVKPTIQYVPFALLFILWLNHERRLDPAFFKRCAVSLFVFFAVLSPWMYRQYTTFGTTMLNVQPVSTTYAYLVPSAIALEKGISFEQASKEFYKEQHVANIEDVNLWNYREFKSRAFVELAKHPVGLTKSIAVTIFTFFTNDAYAGLLSSFGFSVPYAHPPIPYLVLHPLEFLSFLANLMQGPGAFVVIGRLFWILTTLAALWGAILYLRTHGPTPQFLLIAGLIAYFALTTTSIGLAVDGRFRIPVEPLIFILALYALLPLFPREKYGNDRQNSSHTPIPH